MPLGLWKSKWEIHREDMARRDAEWQRDMARRDAEWQRDMDRRDAEWREYRAKSDEQWAEWRKGHDELLARMDENQREAMVEFRTGFKMMVDELRALRREVHELVDAVNANTEAVLKLIDRFDEWQGRQPPGSGRMGPRSA